MISIYVNGKEESVEKDVSVTELLARYGLADRRVAVELNHEIVPRSRHADTRVNDGDRIEIVHAIGGG
ncbi:MAG: sulfur carrier protein ThiS [Xanthomonadales bacterium]|nr:sulfur carrier protein ThiS [Xanthomonadales bacterium]NIX12149.1 sulfur carrier protein ThiS [Xanthomonadales bacterium]